MSGLTREAMSKLVQDVDELLAWKKTFEMKQSELIAWMTKKDLDVENILRGCHAMIDTDKAITKRIDAVSERLDFISERIDIANKRIRKLENEDKRI